MINIFLNLYDIKKMQFRCVILNYMRNLSICMIILTLNVIRKEFKRLYVKSYREPHLGVGHCGVSVRY